MRQSPSTAVISIEGALEDARLQAYEIAAETHREVTPVRIFRQGKREMISGVLPFMVYSRILEYNSAAPKSDLAGVANSTNRPLMKDRVDDFVRYVTGAISRDEPFIVPPLTLNANRGLQVYVPESIRISGYAVLPDETKILITDGQHRFAGLKRAADVHRGTSIGDEIMNIGIPFMMTVEEEMIQVHQDFADAGKTKALPPSMLAVYDTRHPANRAVMNIIERTPLLKGRVDATSSTLGKGSVHIFLVNQVREFVKHSLTGTTGTNVTAFEELAVVAMTNSESKERWIRSRVAFLKALTEIVPDWAEVAGFSEPGGSDSAHVQQVTKDLKARENVPMTGAFLSTMGLVSHKVLSGFTGEDLDDAQMADRLRFSLSPLVKADWSRNGGLWDGGIVNGGKIRTQAPGLRASAIAVLNCLGFASEEDQPSAS